MSPTSPARPSERLARWFRGSAAAWGVVFVLASLGVHGALPKPAKYLVEMLLLAPLLAMFAFHPRVRSTLASLPRTLRWFVVAFVGLLVLGNALKQQRVTFPFMGWGMFGRATTSEPRMVVLVAQRPDGSTFRLIPGGVVSDVAVSSLDGRLKDLLHAVTEATSPEARATAETALVRLLDGLARMHEAGGGTPAGPIAAVRVEDCRTAITAPYARHCDEVGTYPLEESR